MNLKEQLRLYIECNGLNASVLARKSGVPNATISDWLSGRKPRNIDQVKKVADTLNVPLEHLLYGSGIKKIESDLDLESLLGDGWIGGLFEIKLRRVKKN